MHTVMVWRFPYPLSDLGRSSKIWRANSRKVPAMQRSLLAEIAAEAQLDLSRVRKVHTAMIERALMQNAFGGVKHFRSDREELQQLVTQTGRHEKPIAATPA
jgi:hypothetical protein